MTRSGVRLDVDVGSVLSAFASLRRKLADLRAAWAQVGARVDQAVSPFVPVKSGALVDDLKATAGPAGVSVDSNLIYAGVQDRGWPGHNIAGHHFMDRAEAELPGAAVAELAPAMQDVIDRLGLR